MFCQTFTVMTDRQVYVSEVNKVLFDSVSYKYLTTIMEGFGNNIKLQTVTNYKFITDTNNWMYLLNTSMEYLLISR